MILFSITDLNFQITNVNFPIIHAIIQIMIQIQFNIWIIVPKLHNNFTLSFKNDINWVTILQFFVYLLFIFFFFVEAGLN